MFFKQGSIDALHTLNLEKQARSLRGVIDQLRTSYAYPIPRAEMQRMLLGGGSGGLLGGIGGGMAGYNASEDGSLGGALAGALGGTLAGAAGGALGAHSLGRMRQNQLTKKIFEQTGVPFKERSALNQEMLEQVIPRTPKGFSKNVKGSGGAAPKPSARQNTQSVVEDTDMGTTTMSPELLEKIKAMGGMGL